jgi:uncharacterized damage-inducible protein DinB
MKNFCSYALAFTLVLTAGAASAFGQGAPANAMSSANTMSMSPMGSFDYQAKFLNDMKDLQTKFVSLAQAIPQDKYTWRPGDGVRSVSEVFLHVANGNYIIPTAMGAKTPDGFSPQGFEKSTTDKAAIVDQLNKSFANVISIVQAMTPADMAKARPGRGGSTSTAYDILFLITLDLHEHLGQIIAYARVNNVVPPWTAERQANPGRGAGGRGPGAGMVPSGGVSGGVLAGTPPAKP